MKRLYPALAATLAGVLVLATGASAHPERPSQFPDYSGTVPQLRTSGPSLVVCTAATPRRIATYRRPVRERNEALLRRCRYRHIQAAVNDARNGTRILIMPGLYTEAPSRSVPTPDPRCKNDYTASERDPARVISNLGTGIDQAEQGTEKAPTYAHHRRCPNSQNLIGIVGDRLSDRDRRCDDKCNLQLEGTGPSPSDVKIIGSRSKDNVIRADRADGVVFTNFMTQFGDFNNIYVHETNGFRNDNLITRWGREYGLLSFTSDHGLYEDIEGYGTGDSAIYPGSGPQRARCGAYGIEVRRVNSHGNNIGHSGTAGDSTFVHDSRFHDNAAGITMDSFASGHPGMPQDCSRFESNQIYSNNVNVFNESRDEYCRSRPPAKRDRRIVCPSFQVPVGTGILIGGGNGNIVKGNHVYDNWRNGVRQLYVPAAARGEIDPRKQRDTSHRNRYESNLMGVRPGGASDPNGSSPARGDGYADFWWDEEGVGNCWTRNRGPAGAKPTTNVFPQKCPVSTADNPETPHGDPAKIASQAPCASWDPETNSDPPGCDWFNRPPEPK
jgi:hypothetical protein